MPEGRFLIGRSEDCDLCVEDPLASRQHAAIVSADNRLLLQDLGSRNGVFVNRTKVDREAPLQEGDVIRIGDMEMSVVRRKYPRAETLTQMDTAVANDAFRLLGGLADKALALGRGDEAERILGRQLEQILERAGSEGDVDQATAQQATRFALEIATLTKKAKWIDYLFRFHAKRAALMDSELVNELYALCPKVPGASRGVFREYLQALSSQRDVFGPSERFVLSRLDSLEKQL